MDCVSSTWRRLSMLVQRQSYVAASLLAQSTLEVCEDKQSDHNACESYRGTLQNPFQHFRI